MTLQFKHIKDKFDFEDVCNKTGYLEFEKFPKELFFGVNRVPEHVASLIKIILPVSETVIGFAESRGSTELNGDEYCKVIFIGRDYLNNPYVKNSDICKEYKDFDLKRYIEQLREKNA